MHADRSILHGAMIDGGDQVMEGLEKQAKYKGDEKMPRIIGGVEVWRWDMVNGGTRIKFGPFDLRRRSTVMDASEGKWMVGQGHKYIRLSPAQLRGAITVGWLAPDQTMYNNIAGVHKRNLMRDEQRFCEQCIGHASECVWNRVEMKNIADPRKLM